MAFEPILYQDWVLRDRPRWLTGLRDGWGQLWHRTQGAVADVLAAAVREALLAGMVTRAPSDAVRYHAAERDLEQYVGETEDAWRERIAGAWDEWDMAGREDGMRRNLLRSVQALEPGFATIDVYEQWDWGSVSGTQSSRIWVILGDGVESLPWEPLTLGSFTLGDGSTLGSTATRAEVVEFVRIVRKWKSAHSYPVAVILVFPGQSLPDPYDYTLTAWRVGKPLGWGNITLGSITLGGYEIL
jgi:hypothetical protein